MSSEHLSRTDDHRGNRALDEQTGLERIGMRELTLQPGASASVRDADQPLEVFAYLIKGRGVLISPAARVECGAGDFVALEDDGSACRLENTGSHPLTCLIGSR